MADGGKAFNWRALEVSLLCLWFLKAVKACRV